MNAILATVEFRTDPKLFEIMTVLPASLARMTQPTPLELARTGYEAYGEWTGWKNFQGNPMPPWEQLGDNIQHAWVAAAGAIERKLLTPPSQQDSP